MKAQVNWKIFHILGLEELLKCPQCMKQSRCSCNHYQNYSGIFHRSRASSSKLCGTTADPEEPKQSWERKTKLEALHSLISNQITRNYRDQSITTNKVSGGGGIPVALFLILNDDDVKVLHSVCLQIWKTQQWPEDWKRSVFIPIPKKHNAKECSNYRTITLISYVSKVMLIVLQARLQRYMTMKFQMFKLDLQKAEDWEIKLQHLLDHQKQESYRKHLFLLYWLCQSLWLCGSQQTVEKSSRDGNTRPPDLPPEKSVFRSGSNS